MQFITGRRWIEHRFNLCGEIKDAAEPNSNTVKKHFLKKAQEKKLRPATSTQENNE